MWLVASTVLLLFATASGQDLATTTAALQSAAREIVVLDPLEIGLYGLAPKGKPESKDQPILGRLAATNYSSSALISILADPSPRIRTLALELLFRKDDPHLLPYIFKLTTDDAPTFEGLAPEAIARPLPERTRMLWTVRDHATIMLEFFHIYGNFSSYWQARKDRGYCFSWSLARLTRITGGLYILNPGFDRRWLIPFKTSLNKLPPLDRDLYLIWLQSTFTEPVLANDKQLTEAVRRLGRANVLAIADGHPPSQDPDLQWSWDHDRYRLAASLILNHAKNILLPTDAARLAALVNRERRVPDTFVSPAYTILQARLQPERASEVIHAEIRLRPGKYEATARGQLAAALLQDCGKRELPFLREFFYDQPPEGNEPETQLALIKSLRENNRPLVEEILNDERVISLSPLLMASVCQQFPNLPAPLLLKWFYAQKDDPRQMGNSINYFLRITQRAGNRLLKSILVDARLPNLPAPILIELEQQLAATSPRSMYQSFPHLDEELRGYFAGGGTHQLSHEATADLISFLRKNAEYLN